MTSTEDRPFIEPNYRKSVAEIYTEVAIEIVQRQESLRILSATQPIYGEPCARFGGTLPSWVPNWSKESRLVSLGLSNIYSEPYDAGGSTALTRIEKREGQDYPDLNCCGVRLDRIWKTGDVCPIEASGETIAKVLNEWNNLVSTWLMKTLA
jgi:hypothetical protein